MPTSRPDDRNEHEQASEADMQQRYVLRLFVAGSTARSLQAIASVKAVCEEHLAGRYDLEVIDIYQQPDRSERDHVIVAPTLLKALPLPLRRLVGNLSDKERVLIGLDLQER